MLIDNSAKLKKPTSNLKTLDSQRKYLQEIIRSLNSEYFYYVQGKISREKLEGLAKKFDDIYKINLSPKDRFNRFNNDKFDSTKFLVYQGKENNQEIFYYILMTRKNPEQKYQGIFFEREKYFDARDKKQRIVFNDKYEIRKVNKEKYTYNNKVVPAINEVWTVGISEKEQNRLMDKFNKALLARNWSHISQVCFAITKWQGFAEVRKDYLIFKREIEQRFFKFTQSNGKPMTLKEFMLKNSNSETQTEVNVGVTIPDTLPHVRF